MTRSRLITSQYSAEQKTKRDLIEILIFLLYLTCLNIVCNNLTAGNTHHFTQGVRTLLERPQQVEDNEKILLKAVLTVEDFWQYLESVVTNLFHQRLFLNESLLLGPPRLRQLCVRNNTCTVNPVFATYSNNCVAAYSMQVEFNEPVYKGTKYRTLRELGVTSIKGRFHTYQSAGYVQSLTFDRNRNSEIMERLRTTKWLDRNSRLVLFEFNMINLSLNVLQSVKLIFEVMPNGLLNLLYKSDIVYANSPIFSAGWTILLSSLIMYLINFYYTFIEIQKRYFVGCKSYFLSYSVVFNLARIFLLHSSLCLALYDNFKQDIPSVINNSNGSFISLEHNIFIQDTHRNIMAFLVFFSWINLLKYLSFIPALRTIGLAMKLASKDLIAISLLVFLILLAFGNLGVFLFGGSNENFKNFSTAFLTMWRIIITDFDYFELENDFHILAPIFFITYVVLIYFVLLHLFLAVLILSYRTATKTISYKPNYLWYYIRKQLSRISRGLLQPPKYPKFKEGIESNQPLDGKKLRELRLLSYYRETEQDLDILLLRLDLIEDIYYRLTQNMDDLIEKAKHDKQFSKQKHRN